jgi:Flp pilus assembly pilin Flp
MIPLFFNHDRFLKSLAGVARLTRSLSRKKGQTLVEYALILAIISVVAIGVFSVLGQNIATIFSSINNLLDTAQACH